MGGALGVRSSVALARRSTSGAVATTTIDGERMPPPPATASWANGAFLSSIYRPYLYIKYKIRYPVFRFPLIH